ncbi:MAG: hypothetical protein HUJ88_13780 [Fusobacterium necrophorum]|nr:hypothetical protein [Fusobacterium necrophorum]
MGKRIQQYKLQQAGEELEELGRKLRAFAYNSDKKLIDKEEIQRIVSNLKKIVKTLEE